MKNNYYDKSNEFNTEDLDSLKDLSSHKDLDFQARLDIVTEEPGVYMMKDINGKIIYVGKAKNLRKRLSSYFMKTVKGNLKVHTMVEHIADFSYLICKSELEALILESNLIKRYQPFYNILLKDDRDYPYMRISMNEMYPRVEKAYRIGKDREEGCKYYGPYLNADLKSALKTIHEIFPLKTCKRIFPRDIGKERPCIQYYIGRCIGPCRGDVPAEEYRKVCADVCSFLEGRYDELLKKVEKQMRREAEKLDFKAAARSRDRLKSLEKLFERQKVVSTNDEEADILSIESNDLEAIILKLELRSGKISGTSSYFFTMDGDSIDSELVLDIDSLPETNEAEPGSDSRAESDSADTERADHAVNSIKVADFSNYNVSDRLAGTENSDDFDSLYEVKEKFLQAFITQYYPNASYIPQQIIVDRDLQDRELLESYLRKLKGKKVQIVNPKRSYRKELLDMAKQNAKQTLDRRSFLPSKKISEAKENLELLQEYLNLQNVPKRIEAYDIANLGTEAQVCAMVVFENGKVNKKLGRAFYIKEQNYQDDYAAMYQAVNRRLNHINEDENKFGEKPDLILLDGGVGHLNTIKTLFAERNIKDIDLGAMVKDCRHRTRGLVRSDGKIIELAKQAEIIKNNKLENYYSSDTQIEERQVLRMTHDITDDEAKGERNRREKALRLLRFITAIQNEVHRSAGEHHKKLKNKKMLKFRLEEIKGIGENRRKILMKEFGTIKAISEATAEEINERCPSISKKQAQAIYVHFHE